LANGASGFVAIAGKTTNLPTDPADESLIIAATDAIVTVLTAMKGATFDSATDSLEALRDRGDAAWITATGFATPTNITGGTITTVTNLTNLPAAAALEATLTAMKGATFSGTTDSLEAIRDRGDAAWITATGFATPTNITAASGISLAATQAAYAPAKAGDAMALTSGQRTSLAGAINTTQITESYRANAAAPTPAQFMSEVLGHLGEMSISGTTKTLNKLDHSTPAETFTLDDATTPSAITRAT
jgi:hypothetical protein